MKRLAFLTTLVTLIALAPEAHAGTDKLLTDIATQTRGALAFVTCEFEPDSATATAAGTAICIDKSGLFMSLAFNASMRNAKIKKCTLHLPGLTARAMAAELVDIDRETGIGFVKCTDAAAPKWTALAFAETSKLVVGTEVASACLMPRDIDHAPYFGRACISLVRYTPQAMAYVTGGRLTGTCSPVFTSPGKAIGLVWQQSPQVVELTVRGQRSVAQIRSLRDSAFFTPVEDFIHVVKTQGKRKLAWSGIIALRPADKDVMGAAKAGIRVSKIIPGSPAAQAGLKELDVIVKVDSKPLPEMPSSQLVVASLERKLNRMDVGAKITFTLASGKDVTLALAARPEGPTEVARYANRRMGMLARDKAAVDPYISINPAMKSEGVLVVNVGRDSPAIKGDLQRGDVITSVNAQPVRSVSTLRRMLTNVLGEDKEATISITVQRQDESKTLTIKVPGK